jgi:hypothetical protein
VKMKIGALIVIFMMAIEFGITRFRLLAEEIQGSAQKAPSSKPGLFLYLTDQRDLCATKSMGH